MSNHGVGATHGCSGNDCRGAVVKPAVAHLYRTLAKDYSLEDLAKLACLSPFHFHRTFKSVTLTSPARFLAAVRMREAKRLLHMSQLSVAEICMTVGYSSLGTFTTKFTRNVGMSPSSFRRLLHDVGERRVCDGLPTDAQQGSPSRALPLRVRVEGTAVDGAVALIGLFPSALPQGRPVACAVSAVPGNVTLTPPKSGTYYVLAAAVEPDTIASDAMTDQVAAFTVGVAGPVELGSDGAQKEIVRMRERAETDPPVVTALPFVDPRTVSPDNVPRRSPATSK